MLDFLLKYWVLITAIAASIAYTTSLTWKVRTLEKDRAMCEARCLKRLDDLYAEYSNDLKEMKDDLKETMRAVQNMNLSLASLISFLQGKGVTPPQ